MYWCKQKALLLFIAVLTLTGFYACKPGTKSAGRPRYFDLKDFFGKDSARLTQLNKTVLKTVMHNNAYQTKRVHINNWGTEFSLFKSSDINKPAWRNSYSITADSNFTIYRATDPELKTREIMIKKSGGKVKYIMIINHVGGGKFSLYETREKLTYYPDSLYLVEKWQSVRVLGINRYMIKGQIDQ
jgi:hypothetical protein